MILKVNIVLVIIYIYMIYIFRVVVVKYEYLQIEVYCWYNFILWFYFCCGVIKYFYWVYGGFVWNIDSQ